MVGAIILTFVITTLAIAVLFLVGVYQTNESYKNRILKENGDLQRKINEYNENEHLRNEREAYNRGLYDGRKTDALYRNILKRYSAKEQAEVMLNGEQD